MKTKLYIIVTSLFLIALKSQALLPKNDLTKPSLPTAAKVFTGGVAGVGFTLLDVKTLQFKNNDRIVVDIGDLHGKNLKGLPGYFHAEYKAEKGKLILDFAQMPNSFISSQQLTDKLKSVGSIRQSRLHFDPADSSMSLILDLKKSQVKIYQVPGQKTTSRVVIDLIKEKNVR
jgi:hypothetical protein